MQQQWEPGPWAADHSATKCPRPHSYDSCKPTRVAIQAHRLMALKGIYMYIFTWKSLADLHAKCPSHMSQTHHCKVSWKQIQLNPIQQACSDPRRSECGLLLWVANKSSSCRYLLPSAVLNNWMANEVCGVFVSSPAGPRLSRQLICMGYILYRVKSGVLVKTTPSATGF